MRNFKNYIYALLFIIISCSDDDTGSADCSNFTLEVKKFTTNYSAWAEIYGAEQPISYLWSNGATTSTIGNANSPLAIGTYTVRVKDGRGCERTGSITIAHQLAVVTNTADCVGSTKTEISVDVTDNNIETPITQKGVCYSLTPNPTINSPKVIYPEISEPKIQISGLSMGTTYYLRGYAINAAGVSYAPQLTITTTTTTSSLSIGQTYQGGIIAYLTCDGLHGFVVRSTPMPDRASWIVASESCENLVHNGYSDWYLPNITQVKQIRQNAFLLGLGNFNTGNTIYDNYWSSPRFYNTNYAGNYFSFYWDFDTNTGGELSNHYQLHYRPVRNF